jgi:hypothetical protein
MLFGEGDGEAWWRHHVVVFNIADYWPLIVWYALFRDPSQPPFIFI